MSVRSSTDEFDSMQKMNELKKTRMAADNGFDLFFKQGPSSAESKVPNDAESETNYKMISPAKGKHK